MKKAKKTPQSGVYEIVNTLDGKRYVGSAQDIPARWIVHQHFLRKGKHHSAKLQNAWNKYGEAVFELLVLEVCDRSRLYEVEQAHIDALSPEYNMTLIAESPRGARACHRPDWTPEMDALLLDRYRELGSVLAQEMGISASSVRHRAMRLGIPCETRKGGRKKKVRAPVILADPDQAAVMKAFWGDEKRSAELRASRKSAEFSERMRVASLQREAKGGGGWRDENLLRKLYLEDGLSFQEIGRQLGCSGVSIGKWIRSFGLMRPRLVGQRGPTANPNAKTGFAGGRSA